MSMTREEALEATIDSLGALMEDHAQGYGIAGRLARLRTQLLSGDIRRALLGGEVLVTVNGWLPRDDWPLVGEPEGYDAEFISIFEWREGEQKRYVPIIMTICARMEVGHD